MGALRLPELGPANGCEPPRGDVTQLGQFLADHERMLVITGAGCSTASGIPAYRDGAGKWQQRSPILYPDFVGSPKSRRRYWARSFYGWPAMAKARINGAHEALVELERTGRINHLITQNVDGLHPRAGQQRLIELHGRLRDVRCLECGDLSTRDELQARLEKLNPDWAPEVRELRPDGDAELDERAYPGFQVADCEACGGRLKPDVVFFGESIPKARHEQVSEALAESDAVLVVGTSLVVASAYRIVRNAAKAGLPIAAVNDGRTRADDLLAFKVPGACHEVLAAVAPAKS